eukprot:gnl/TRDRNA2_/TRDRNA2_131790_c0_seq2.p1 gnl/TRDRNA2_/TRDRNA2_131790_c0~~gnl/TRDRNA2_/TRDRNA2_131790_c0_seq2.p1  ORF type:complete len:346 (-),score=88.68 gnl/TRDRNA2_/TRDRNA2_131790_c0_seq2:168-1205(-)
MQSSMSASSTFHAFQTIAAEETWELFLIILSAVAWWYFEGMRNCLREFVNDHFRAAPPNLKLKPVKCLEEEEVKVDGSSSEPESEQSTTQKVSQTTLSAVPEPADLSEPESQDKIDSSNITIADAASPAAATVVFFPPPGLTLPGSKMADPPEKPKKRKKANAEPRPQTDIPQRELGRCVCWKDCFGFIVDESGARLFVRQTDVASEKALTAGQVVWFRRGKPQRGEKTKRAVDVSLVDIELAKMLRSAEKDGISWTAFREAVVDDDAKILASSKSLKSIANHKTKLASFKTEATKVPAKKVPIQAETTNDVDLKAFLGSGSAEEIQANLKYAPQWVAEKLNVQA